MAKKKPKEFRMEDILTAAIDEFAEKGYEGASIDAIAAKAGVSKGGFYYHFTNKEHLLMEVNNRLNEPMMEFVERALADPDPIEGFRQYVISYLNHWIQRPKELSFLFLSMSKALESVVLSDYYRQYVDGSNAFFTAMLQRINETEQGDISSPEMSAMLIMGSLDGIVSYAIVHPELDIEKIADQLVTFGLKSNR